jgi:hypothetical protein
MTVTLNADGTYVFVEETSQTGGGVTESYNTYMRGYYRVIDGDVVFIGNDDIDIFMRSGRKGGQTDFSGLPILGEWVAADGDSELLAPAVRFNANGMLDLIDFSLEGNRMIFSLYYSVTGDDEYAVSMLVVGDIILNITQGEDTLTVVVCDYSDGTEIMTLNYVRGIYSRQQQE